MRVIEVSQRYPPALGGVEATLAQLVAHLRRAGVDVEVLTTDLARTMPFRRLPPAATVAADEGVVRVRAYPFAPLPLGLGVAAPGMLHRLLRAEGPLVHAHAFGHPPAGFAALAGRLRGTRWILTTHADPGRGSRVARLFHRAAAWGAVRRADAVVVQSEGERRFLAGLGVDPRRMVTIPTGIDLPPERPPGRKGPADGPCRLLCVGRLDLAQKGLDVLIDAVARVSRVVPVRLDLAGDDWGAVPAIARQVHRLGLGDRVRWAVSPTAEAIAEAYARADVFVLASRFESFPRVLVEALAEGLPIVATRVGGVEELVGTGGAALLVPPGDPDALARAIAEVAADPERRRRMAEAARARAGRYAWETIVPRYLALFAAVSEGRFPERIGSPS
ncbi:MAG: glycosyltransferase family 4 protein [Thermoplasmata archaeon]